MVVSIMSAIGITTIGLNFHSIAVGDPIPVTIYHTITICIS